MLNGKGPRPNLAGYYKAVQFLLFWLSKKPCHIFFLPSSYYKRIGGVQPRLFIPLQILSPRWTNTIIDALDRAAYKESFSCENLFFFFSNCVEKTYL